MSERVLIIIPALNEESNIGGVLDRLRRQTPYRDILVINDGSSDRTSAVATECGAVVADLPFTLGIGAAVQTGYKYAFEQGYDYAVRVDGDGQHDVTQIADLLAPLTARKADLVIGSRVLSEAPYQSSFPRRVGIRVLSSLVSRVVRQPVTDTTSGFRGANRQAIAAFAEYYPDDYPEVESIIWAHRRGFRIVEVGARMTERTGGESSITAIRSVYYMIKVVFAVMIELMRKVDVP